VNDLEQSQEAAKVAAQKDAIKKELEQLQIVAWEANQKGDATGYDAAKKSQATKQEQLEKIGKDLDNGIAKLQTEVDDLEKTISKPDELNKIATAEVKFSRQIEYMKQVERSQKLWANPLSLAGGSIGSAAVTAGAASTLGTAATLGVGGLYGATAGVAIKNRADTLKAIAKDIDKEYGKGGPKTIGKQKRQNKRKENQEADKDEYGDDKKDKEGDDKDE
jgi:hypothetical protein